MYNAFGPSMGFSPTRSFETLRQIHLQRPCALPVEPHILLCRGTYVNRASSPLPTFCLSPLFTFLFWQSVDFCMNLLLSFQGGWFKGGLQACKGLSVSQQQDWAQVQGLGSRWSRICAPTGKQLFRCFSEAWLLGVVAELVRSLDVLT